MMPVVLWAMKDRGHRERGDDRKRNGERRGTARTRRGLCEDRQHDLTIAARSSLCSREMAARAARSKPRSKPVAATTPTPSPSPGGRRDGADRADRADLRRWIYGGLDALFAAIYAVAIWKVIPNRLPSAAIHLWTFPLATLAMAAGTLSGTPKGWWIAVAGGSAVLLSTFLLIVRILISAAFLAGVYGAFGQAAATFALVMVALVIELVALLPVVQVKYLMTRAGRRAYGMPAR
jgi:hypothetical protein